MVAVPSNSSVFSLLLAVSSATLLSGCLEEQSSGFAGRGGDEVTLTGSVGDGPIVSADMRVLGASGGVIASFTSDTSASYQVTLDVSDDEFPLIIDAVGGTDLVTGQSPDFVLESVVLSAGEQAIANLNPFSTMIVSLAEQLDGGLNATNVSFAEAVVVAELNSGLNELASTGIMRSRVTDSNIAEIVKSSEALAELLRRTSGHLSNAGFVFSTDDVIVTIASDLADGVIDGRGGDVADARVSAVATLVYGQVLLESMANELRVGGSNAAAAMNDAIRRVGNSPARLVEDLPVTEPMIDKARVSLAAAYTISGDERFRGLHSTVSGLNSAMDPTMVRSLIPSDYGTAIAALLPTVAAADVTTLDMINEVARSDGNITTQNRPPQIEGVPDTAVAPGATYSFTPTASDPDGDALTFAISNLPAWATFDVATGTLTGIPADGDMGRFADIVISVSDGDLDTSLEPFTIVVTTGNSPPDISGSPARSVVAGEAYSFTPTASDPDDDVLSFSISNKPAWASFDTSTGRLSGTPRDSDAGRYDNIVITVSDGELTDRLARFAIEVVLSNSPPTIGGSPASTVTVGQVYSFTPTAADADGGTLDFRVANLPSWASFDSATGTLSGTPRDGDVGNYSQIRVTVSDGTDTASMTWSITVEAVSLGSIRLSWTAPTQNNNGTPLTDLAGYRIYWGLASGSYTDSVTIRNPGITTYVVENLAPGTYEFATKSFNTAGIESLMSEPATGTVP